MNRIKCRVRKIENSRIYLVSDRVGNIVDGDYILDEDNDLYLVYLMHLIPVDGSAKTPSKRYDRVEATNDKRINMYRMTQGFMNQILKHGVTNVYIHIKPNGKVRLGPKRCVMVKPEKGERKWKS